MTGARNETTFSVGDLLNNTFRIEAILGQGGTSEVYRARNEISGRLVALKVLKAEFAGNENFLVLMKREEEMRDIRHGAVVGYSENHRTADGHIYLVMDFVDGPSLEARMDEGGMSAEDLMVVCRRVVEGLQAAHERRIVHRDLSPDNIILKGGDPARAVIIDFGIAKDANPGAKTVVGSDFAGKFAYAAPEQLGGNTDARSDIYALGVTLLATFRGEPPDMGSNLLEVLDRKKNKLDLNGVPEPLYGILDRMVQPDPNKRFQSCGEILEAINRVEADFDDEVTLVEDLRVAPLSSEPKEPHPAKAAPAQQHARPSDTAPAASKPVSPAEAKSGRGPLVAIVLVLLLAAAGGGAWFLGLFGGGLPVAKPYVLAVDRVELGGPVMTGHVPSQAMLDRLTTAVTADGGTADLSLARGDLADGWEEAVDETLKAADTLESYSVRVEDNQITLDGNTGDAAVRDKVSALFNESAMPAGMVIDGKIDYTPPPLSAAALTPILDTHADCGPLALADPPAGGYTANDTIDVTGALSTADARVALYDSLEKAAAGRDIRIETEILNPALCLAEKSLPDVPKGGFDIDFSFGKTGKPNPAGRFFVGENPVIDVVLPADVATGYLYVSILDVTGSVFHLLPNVNRSENSVAKLRDGRTGAVPVRVAYPASDASADRIAFLVDDSLLGKSKVLVIHATSPLFDSLRPTAESVEGYAHALELERISGKDAIASLDSRVLTMEKN